MKRSYLIICCLIINCFYTLTLSSQVPECYNVCWTSQSENSSESMPLGGGSIGLNVWVENGEVLFYLSKSGAFDENNQLLKLGRCRLRISPNPFDPSRTDFKQQLYLNESKVEISSKSTTVRLWVEVHRPLVHVEVYSASPVDVEAGYENWRMVDRLLPISERSACFSYSAYAPDIYTYHDNVEVDAGSVLFYHRNRADRLLFDFILKQQKLEDQRPLLLNTQLNRTFGGQMQGQHFAYKGVRDGSYCNIPYRSFVLQSEKPACEHRLSLALSVEQASDLGQWKQQIKQLARQADDSKSAYRKNLEWWKAFWNRSYIYVNLDKGPDDKGFQIGRNYQLFRYMLACNAYGDYPTKFNGGLFTFDAPFTPINGQVINGTPDYRAWGGGSHTAQNQRLVYWPMLKSGDFDLMKPQFDFYNRAYKNAEVRTLKYWGHKGCCFTEHTETFGLPAAATWGFDHLPRLRPDSLECGVLYNPWVQYHYTNQLEFSFMMLQYAAYSGKSIREYVGFITSALTFFFEHYTYRQMKRNGQPYDSDRKLVIYPSTACETFKNIKNPTDICAALTTTIKALLELPDADLSASEKKRWQEKLTHVPQMTYGLVNGKKVLLPANNPPKNINTDIPELYPVFPYGLLGVGKPNLDIAINTWRSDFLTSRKNYISWHQDAIFCARMGLADEAMEITLKKLTDAPRRFPAFWGPGHDYVPDHNWGGSGMIGLQEMLLQTGTKDELIFLPAWPSNYDVRFKLHASHGRVVEVNYKEGKIISNKCVCP